MSFRIIRVNVGEQKVCRYSFHTYDLQLRGSERNCEQPSRFNAGCLVNLALEHHICLRRDRLTMCRVYSIIRQFGKGALALGLLNNNADDVVRRAKGLYRAITCSRTMER